MMTFLLPSDNPGGCSLSFKQTGFEAKAGSTERGPQLADPVGRCFFLKLEDQYLREMLWQAGRMSVEETQRWRLRKKLKCFSGVTYW